MDSNKPGGDELCRVGHIGASLPEWELRNNGLPLLIRSVQGTDPVTSYTTGKQSALT